MEELTKKVEDYLDVKANRDLLQAKVGKAVETDSGNFSIAKAKAYLMSHDSIEQLDEFIHSLADSGSGQSSTPDSGSVRIVPAIGVKVDVVALDVYAEPKAVETVNGAKQSICGTLILVSQDNRVEAPAINLTLKQMNWLVGKLANLTNEPVNNDVKNYPAWNRASLMIESGLVKALANVREYKVGDYYVSPDREIVGTCERPWKQTSISRLLVDFKARREILEYLRWEDSFNKQTVDVLEPAIN